MRERCYALPVFGMEKRYNCSKSERTQSQITFWFYVISTPIIIVLFLLRNLEGGVFRFSPFSLIYIAIVLLLCYCGYRAFRVMLSTKRSYCVITDDRVSGISTPSPFEKGIPFDIAKSEILGIGKTDVPVGGMRTYNALVLNTNNRKIVLFAIDNIEEIKKELTQ